MTDELIGTRLGQYELIELVRRGGMAAVYKAHQPSLDRFVAVKVLFHNRDPQFALRFKREARAIAQLQHPNILQIYDYGEQDGLLFLSLQLVENGTTLTDLIAAAQPLEPAHALNLVRRLLSALEYAHRRGIIHRDIKPSNVLMPEPDWPMLADFGIAKLLNDEPGTQQLTMPGFAVGTAAYMAPEQALAQPVDARTDLYSLGVLLYELLTGHVPFDAEQSLAVMTKHLYERPTPPRLVNASIPPAVEALVLRALEKRPGDRYQTASEMSAALEEVSAQLPRGESRDQLAALYQAGVVAFAEGRWDQAVEQLGRLVASDPEYEDGADLLAAAEEASRRARAEAREQIELVRQRRSSATLANLDDAHPPADAAAGNSAGAPGHFDETAAAATARMPAPPAGAATGDTARMPAPPADAATGDTARMPAPPAGAATGDTARMPAPPADAATGDTARMPAPPAGAPGHFDETAAATSARMPAPPAGAATGDTARMPTPPAGEPSPPPGAPGRLAETAAAALPHQTIRLDEPHAPAAAPAPPDTGAPPGAAPPRQADGADTQTRGLPLPLIIGAAAAILVGLLIFAALALRPGAAPEPTAVVGGTAATPTAAAAPPSPAPTAAAAAPTMGATAAAPTPGEPSPEPLPAPAGALVFEDDFENGPEQSGLLAPWAAPELVTRIDAGSYTMDLAAPGEARRVLMPRLVAGSLSLQVDLADTSADREGRAALGVVFRARGDDQFYALLIDPRAGAYSAVEQDGDGPWSELIPWTPSPLIRQGDATNRLRIDAQDDSFTFYLNGAPLDSLSDESFASGMVGTVALGADAGETQMRFDNLRIWSADAPERSTLPATLQNALGSDMVLIPGGEFVMGGNDDPDDLPHVVALPDFYIDRKEVTNVIYFDCVHTRGCAQPVDLGSATRESYFVDAESFGVYPVLNVTWEQASAFCARYGKRLPTEAEWEKAASWIQASQTKLRWPWGNQLDPERLNSAEGARGDTTPVGTFPAGANDIFDMAGNVAEWTSSLDRPYPYAADDGREDPEAAGPRVVRGGSWGQPADAGAGHARQPAEPATAGDQVGFRCAASP